jgi:hypothetical protein
LFKKLKSIIFANRKIKKLAIHLPPEGRSFLARCLIKEKWIEDCEKYGIPSHKENEPIPFWDNEEDAKGAFEEFYKEIGND